MKSSRATLEIFSRDDDNYSRDAPNYGSDANWSNGSFIVTGLLLTGLE